MVVALVLMALTALAVVQLHRHRTIKPPPPPQLEKSSTCSTPEHMTGCDTQLQEEAISLDTINSTIQGYLSEFPLPQPISPYVPNTPSSVLILYSLDTPEEELGMVNSLLVGGLAQYNIQAEAPGLASPREVSRDWLEGRVKEVDAVLLFCNQQLYEEWSSSHQREGEDRIGYWVRQLKDNVKDLGKFAYVYMEERDRQYSELSLYIGRRFCITRNIDTTRNIDLEPIAKFVCDAPRCRR